MGVALAVTLKFNISVPEFETINDAEPDPPCWSESGKSVKLGLIMGPDPGV